MIVVGQALAMDLHSTEFDAAVMLHLVNSEARKVEVMRVLRRLKRNARVIVVNCEVGGYQDITWPQVKAELFPEFTVVEIPNSDIPQAFQGAWEWEMLRPQVIVWLLAHGLLHHGAGMDSCDGASLSARQFFLDDDPEDEEFL